MWVKWLIIYILSLTATTAHDGKPVLWWSKKTKDSVGVRAIKSVEEYEGGKVLITMEKDRKTFKAKAGIEAIYGLVN